jgi:hypothetical protein
MTGEIRSALRIKNQLKPIPSTTNTTIPIVSISIGSMPFLPKQKYPILIPRKINKIGIEAFRMYRANFID